MRHWLSAHGRACARTLRRLADSPMANLLNMLAIGIAMALPLGLYVVLQNLQGMARDWRGEPELFLFLDVGAGSADLGEVESRLRGRKDLASYRFVPKASALTELKANTGLGELIDSLGTNPLPDGFAVKPRSSQPGDLETLRAEMLEWPKVEHVQLDMDWARRLDAAVRLGRLAVLILAGLLSVAMVAVSFNTIRLQLLTRRDEIEVASLVGATPSFIRRPFLYFGGLLGFLGGVTAWLIVAMSLHLLRDGLADVQVVFGWEFGLHDLGLADGLAALSFATLLGWLGAWLAASIHLTQTLRR
jgi:cell division transport system permease protein